MGKYRKLPVVIDAFKWTGGHDQSEDPEWLVKSIEKGHVWFTDVGTSFVTMHISTFEGVMNACVGDYIIRGIKGELYPCKPEIFEVTYEPAVYSDVVGTLGKREFGKIQAERK